MRENRSYGLEGGESGSTGLPYPYRSEEPTLSLHLPALASSDNRIGPIINYLSSSNEPNHQTRLTPCFLQFDNFGILLIFRIEGVSAVKGAKIKIRSGAAQAAR